MSIDLSSLSSEQLLYIKQKWSTEKRELELDHARAAERLATRLDRRSANAEEVAAMEARLSQAQTLLQHLQTTSAPTELITAQQAEVDNLQTEYDTQSVGSGVLTNEEAVLQQVAVDELDLRKTYREDKIAEVDALLNPQDPNQPYLLSPPMLPGVGGFFYQNNLLTDVGESEA